MDPSYAGRLLRTEDLGKTWSVLPMPDKHVSAVVNDGSRLAVLTADGVEISLDGGAPGPTCPSAGRERSPAPRCRTATCWSPGTSGSGGSRTSSEAPAPPTRCTNRLTGASPGVAATGAVVAVSERDRVTTSTDGGLTWRTTEPLGSFAIDVHAVGNELFRATSNNGYARSTTTASPGRTSPTRAAAVASAATSPGGRTIDVPCSWRWKRAAFTPHATTETPSSGWAWLPRPSRTSSLRPTHRRPAPVRVRRSGLRIARASGRAQAARQHRRMGPHGRGGHDRRPLR
jgi:hypothetical protein